MILKHWLSVAALGAALGAVGSVAGVGVAMAQPTSTDPKERSKYWYDDGRKQYDLGNFEKAVESFKKAYEEWPDGAFLYNIAQSYRELDDYKNALRFYKRFLAVKTDAPEAKKKEVEGHITSLEKLVKDQEDFRNRPPAGTVPPDPDVAPGGSPGAITTTPPPQHLTTGGPGASPSPAGGGGSLEADGDDADGAEAEAVVATGAPKTISARAGFGGAVVGAGDLPEDIPMQVSLALGAGYPIAISEVLGVDVGASIAYTPLPWTGTDMETGTSSFTTLLANLGATYAVTPAIAVRGDLGIGMLLLGGLSEGNPFTIDAVAATGALATPAVRIGLSGEYALTKNIAAVVTPIAFSYSTAKDGLKDEISAFTRLEFMVGIGYRM